MAKNGGHALKQLGNGSDPGAKAAKATEMEEHLFFAFMNQYVIDARGARVPRKAAAQTALTEAQRRPELGDLRFYSTPKIESDGRWSATIGFGGSAPRNVTGKG